MGNSKRGRKIVKVAFVGLLAAAACGDEPSMSGSALDGVGPAMGAVGGMCTDPAGCQTPQPGNGAVPGGSLPMPVPGVQVDPSLTPGTATPRPGSTGATGSAAGAGGAATEPTPTQPEPTEPTPTQPEPEPTEPEPTEPEPTPSNPNDPFDTARQACVEHINMYRATLGLSPLSRATPEQEACSDMGAKTDAEVYEASRQGHTSAGTCRGLGAQNSCPSWPLRGTLEQTLLRCLDSMWDEGEPPIPRDQCKLDYEGCFFPHGHYINMSEPNTGVVACGFYELPDGRYYMNQDFGR